jgi:hypothetical protein
MKKTLASPIEVWRALQTDAGLELRRSKGVAGRDADFEAALLAAVSGHAGSSGTSSSLEDFLLADSRSPSPQVTVESLLEAILAEQIGFAAMMSDILETLVMADAVNAKDTLDISFSFNSTSAPLRLTLEAFRQQVEKIKSVLVTQWIVPPDDSRWVLLRNLADLVGVTDYRRAPYPPLAAPDAAPASGHQGLDEALGDLMQLASEFCSECMKYGTDRKAVYDTVKKLFPDYHSGDLKHAIARSLAGQAHDGWDVQFVDIVQRIAYAAKTGSRDGKEMVAGIQFILSAFPSRQTQLEKKYSELSDVLSLPAWKQRHELYSVWVGTALLRVAKQRTNRLQFNPVNGVLSFAFGGSRLATYEWEGQQYDVWAEFRSDLTVRSEKRKKGIQPDFRVMKATIGGSDNAKTTFVLECKHYLKPSLSNFTQAAHDYSKTCANAKVFVVNHGPADHDLLASSLSDDIAGRVRFLGEMTPGTRKAELERAIGDTLFPAPPPSARPGDVSAVPAQAANGKSTHAGTIRLAWDTPLRDIDLSVKAMDRRGNLQAEINYASLGALHENPYAQLQEDVQSGPGAEQIDIQQWHFDRYQIVATNFSGAPEMLPGRLRCTVFLGQRCEIIEFPASGDPYAPWHVGTVEVVDGVASLTTSG